eukprot:scaffold4916_cov371-Prasinococcus_capsulatus_cf.AAC.1
MDGCGRSDFEGEQGRGQGCRSPSEGSTRRSTHRGGAGGRIRSVPSSSSWCTGSAAAGGAPPATHAGPKLAAGPAHPSVQPGTARAGAAAAPGREAMRMRGGFARRLGRRPPLCWPGKGGADRAPLFLARTEASPLCTYSWPDRPGALVCRAAPASVQVWRVAVGLPS